MFSDNIATFVFISELTSTWFWNKIGLGLQYQYRDGVEYDVIATIDLVWRSYGDSPCTSTCCFNATV